jgi:hypothetical protein
MTGRILPGTDVRVRRGRRRDLAALGRTLGVPVEGRLARVFRRILADLGNDVYVAEDAGGELVGVVSVVYRRSLMQGGLAAVLDGVRTRPEAAPLLDGLVAFAEERARRRGCRRLTACVAPEDAAVRAALVARGYRPGEAFAPDPRRGA